MTVETTGVLLAFAVVSHGGWMIGYGLWGMGDGLKTMQRYEKKSGYAIVCPESCESCHEC